MSIRRSLDSDFFKKWTPEMAYVLGYFAADGSMLRNKRGGHYIEFTTTDRRLLEIVRRAARGTQRIALRPSRNEKWKPEHRLQVGSKTWFEDLTRLGFTQAKSRSLRFPPVPAALIGHFVRGY
ncbi:MAG: LAGLIDADG family homing endonuclease, partial [Patescibacteria group bacterium]|nr:LAGLIDADG family homing endonuclease [Patescibacteria group bacterium]